mgnify:CR=1 FL=1
MNLMCSSNEIILNLEFYSKNKDRIEQFATAEETLRQFTNITKSKTPTVNVYTREDLRNALKNLGNSQERLRDISWYLYYRVSIYWRIIQFYANQIDLGTRYVIPNNNLTKKDCN